MSLKELKNLPASRAVPTASAAPALTPRARTALGYMVHGIDEPSAEHPDVPVGKALGPDQVAKLLGTRRQYVRGLLSDPVFKLEFTAAVERAHLANLAPAVSRHSRLIESEDERVAMNAVKLALGGEGKAGASVNLNVTSNTTHNVLNVSAQPQLKAGFVLDLREDRTKKFIFWDRGGVAPRLLPVEPRWLEYADRSKKPYQVIDPNEVGIFDKEIEGEAIDVTPTDTVAHEGNGQTAKHADAAQHVYERQQGDASSQREGTVSGKFAPLDGIPPGWGVLRDVAERERQDRERQEEALRPIFRVPTSR